MHDWLGPHAPHLREDDDDVELTKVQQLVAAFVTGALVAAALLLVAIELWG